MKRSTTAAATFLGSSSVVAFSTAPASKHEQDTTGHPIELQLHSQA